ncbi:MAG TPA: twin-arginine translocation signal domain-containing protein [Ktedonobacterales bacterium]|nr:twin-arginine translocation signal domain-containing protein [Ktedonobacterales bacterium]
MNDTPQPSDIVARSPVMRPYVGHEHFWERAFSRRQFIGAAAGVTGALATSAIWFPNIALADGVATAAPRPIPGGIQPFGPGTEIFHVFVPGKGAEMSSIFDFDGYLGVAVVDGTGKAYAPGSDTPMPLVFDTDMRFMKGRYIGLDGERHRGTFAFI